ncbi:hypothetical protein IWQ55_006194 [Labrenzia sp. EL_208]|nr:hypothetical protein [Labrenzia sp. EL_132]MBG6211540.1 hypothetical protein [Labrenzia sp. EL_126]MBG6232960.1 hypothetical protein [Labrenzia sp. EL_208]
MGIGADHIPPPPPRSAAVAQSEQEQSEAKQVPFVQIIDGRLLPSIFRDLSSFGCLSGMMSIGLIMDSSAFQWIAGVVGLLFVVARANRDVSKSRMTVSEARAYLDGLEAKSGSTQSQSEGDLK